MSNVHARQKPSRLSHPGLLGDGDERQLRQLQKVKTATATPCPALGLEMVAFFKHAVEKRQTKLGKIADCWKVLVPQTMNEHCALEGINRGSLTVVVDSSPHLYELKQLLLAGLEKQLLFACKSAGLRKIVLKSGRWYAGDSDADRKIDFGR